MSGFLARVDRVQQRHHWLGYPLAVIYKFVDDQGGYLAALITYYAFVSLFPLLLILSTVLGVVLKTHAHLQQRILDSAVSQFPVIGDQLGHPERLSGGTVGILGAVFGGLGVSVAVQNAMNVARAVPRNQRPPKRPTKKGGFVIDIGKSVRPIIAPDDPDATETTLHDRAQLGPAADAAARDAEFG